MPIGKGRSPFSMRVRKGMGSTRNWASKRWIGLCSRWKSLAGREIMFMVSWIVVMARGVFTDVLLVSMRRETVLSDLKY